MRCPADFPQPPGGRTRIPGGHRVGSLPRMPTLPTPSREEHSPERLFFIMAFVFVLVLTVIVGFVASGQLWLLICAMLALVIGTGAVIAAIMQQLGD